MGVPSKRLAFVSPQGTMLLRNDKYLTSQGSTAENGGQIIYVIEMARSMAAEGHSVDIFARNYDTPDLIVEQDKDFPGVRIFHIPTRAPAYTEKEHFYPFYPEYLGYMTKIVDEYDAKYDAIVGHYADGMMLGVGLERYLEETRGAPIPTMGITHSLGIEKAHSLHTTYLKSGSVDLAGDFHNAVQKYNIKARLGCELAALAHIDGMVCVSGSHMKILYDDYKYPEDQMAIIPGGINSEVFYKRDDVKKADMLGALVANRPDLSEATIEAISEGKIVFGFGRLVKAKGVVNAVKSMDEVLKQQPNTVYMYAGGNIPPQNEEEQEVFNDAMASSKEGGYEDRIVFMGRQDQKVIASWLSVSDVYLHAAALEPFGLAPQEAAATGIPTVISKYAGVSEVLQNNIHSLHTDAQSPADIAKQVGRLLDNPTLGHRLANEALKYIEENATWGARANHVISFLEEEVAPRYFARRAQRELNGNAYHGMAKDMIIHLGSDGLPEDLARRTDHARNTLVSLLPIGLPASTTRASQLDFDGN